MKQTFLSILLMLLPMMASADAVEIGGIWYNLVAKAKEAEVTKNPNGTYSGDVFFVAKKKGSFQMKKLLGVVFCPQNYTFQ